VPQVSRRYVLTLAAVGALVTACAPVSHPRPTKKPTAKPTTSPATSADWAALAAGLAGSLARPGDATYDQVRLTENPRWDGAHPIAVLTAASATDVAAGLAFAGRHGIPLALRSGGHSYPGYSAGGAAGTGVPSSLVIDSRGMSAVNVNADGSVRVGSGAALAQVYSQLAANGRAIAGGSCATVGIAGLTLGGGVGVLTRAYGLTCDQLTEVEIVTADGTVHTANATKDSDLFWACRGGGGGHLGVVTALTFSTHAAPTVTTFALQWPFAAGASVIEAFQSWIATADRQLWATLKLLNGPAYRSGPGVFVSGTWIGASAQLAAQLAPLIAKAGAPSSNRSAVRTYGAAMASYAGCATIPVAQCNTGPGGSLQRESFAATSHIAYQSLDAAGIQTVLQKVTAAGSIPGVREAGISMDALGGAVADVSPTATAFPHRKAIMSVQYTGTFPDGTNPAPFDTYVRGFRAALTPQWGEGAYVNYSDPSLTDPAQSYFAGNAPRLARIRTKYDPRGLFTQPQSY
jgi:hypothetical protein